MTLSRPSLRPTCPLCFPQRGLPDSTDKALTLDYLLPGMLLPKQCRWPIRGPPLISCLCPSSFGECYTVIIFPVHFWYVLIIIMLLLLYRLSDRCPLVSSGQWFRHLLRCLSPGTVEPCDSPTPVCGLGFCTSLGFHLLGSSPQGEY
jgi:hypothetical protein